MQFYEEEKNLFSFVLAGPGYGVGSGPGSGPRYNLVLFLDQEHIWDMSLVPVPLYL